MGSHALERLSPSSTALAELRGSALNQAPVIPAVWGVVLGFQPGWFTGFSLGFGWFCFFLTEFGFIGASCV